MNDKAIRDILISYLQASNKEIRIYQEKSIGASICDVMAVTDRLTGYEIKSDLDNFSRLNDQVRAYDRFFDENFLVVSNKYSLSASEKVPDHWGILCIHNDSVTVLRKAQRNRYVFRRNQLSILWKLELKNLLIKNNMPLFAQKDKNYISEQITNAVEDSLLGKQIAEELMRRDYSVYNAEDFTLYSKSDNSFPAEEIIDMLSEKDPEQMSLDRWIDLYRQATTVREQKETLWKKQPEERTPHDIPYTDIEVSLGVPWISAGIIADFIAHILGRSSSFSIIGMLHYEPVTGNWCIREKKFLGAKNTNAEVKYGLERYNALFIIEATLNLREIKLFDNGTEYNERDTLAALEKQRLINEEFRRWIWLDEDRRWQVEEEYNKIFTQYKKQVYDGSALVFPDMSPDYQLFDYQKEAVQKILTSPNTLLAFDVGAGKTFIMISAAMKLRQEGISRKNLFVVPNHIVGQWEKIFTDLYPKARVLAIEPKSFKPQMRQKVLSQIRDGDYDGVIMAYSCFEMIPLTSAVILNNMDRQLERLSDALKELKFTKSYNSTNIRAIEKEKKRIRSLTQDFLDSMSAPETEDITFDKLEINTLFVDEAHNYKNIPIHTKLKNLNGINTKGSVKCLDLLHKVRHIQSENDGRGVVFATGTPLCNSISDAYAMQMYLQPEELEKSHLDVFDNWVKTFAQPEQLCEIDVDTSKFRFIRKFSRFFNLPELSRMFSQIAIFHAVNSTEDMPVLEGYTDEVIKKYPELTDYMKSLCDRTEAIRGKLVTRREDNMLKVSTDGRKAALHLSLVGQKQPEGENSKVCRCVQNTAEIYRKYPDATQLIFCDYSTPKGNAFNVYDEIRNKLEELGVPKKEIAFIHHYNTESRKLELFRRFNNGEMRVLIGSTFKLGIGANVQVRLKAIHHLDVPWRPADMIQREGRILRRGNENRDVLIYRYITEGSFDSYSWQILETKQRFITQFLSGSTYQRSIADLENNVLTYAQVKALALSEPLMKQLAEKENEIKNLRILLSKEKQSLENLQQELSQTDKNIFAIRERNATTAIALSHLRSQDKKAFPEAYNSIRDLLTEELLFNGGKAKKLPSVLGFRLTLPEKQNEKEPYIMLCLHEQKYIVKMGSSPEGNARRVINTLKSFDKISEKDKKALIEALERKSRVEKIVNNPENSYAQKLAECEADARQLRSIIAQKNESAV